jgi:hypothetical protein
MPHATLDATFQPLRAILKLYESRLVTVHDQSDGYYLDTAQMQSNNKPLFFASARVAKQYVSFHLMPVYVWPELLEGTSEQLRKRMQGKSCFNFKKPEPELFEELASLTRRGFERYRDTGYVT